MIVSFKSAQLEDEFKLVIRFHIVLNYQVNSALQSKIVTASDAAFML